MRVFLPLTDDSSSLLTPAILAVVGLVLGSIYVKTKQRQLTNKTVSADKIHHLPTTQPILGDLVAAATNQYRWHDWVSDQCLHFNSEPWRFRILGQADCVVFSSPEAVEDIMTTQFANFPRGEMMNSRLRQLLGHSILTTDGDEWFHQRKIAAKFFTGKTLRHCMQLTMHKNMDQMYHTLDRSILHGENMDMMKLFVQFTLQTFMAVGLGLDFELIGATKPHEFEAYLEVGSAVSARRFTIPEFVWRFEKWLGIGDEGEFTKLTESTHKWFHSVVEQSLALMAKRQRERLGESSQAEPDPVKSVVELFLEFSEEDKAGVRQNDLVGFLLSFVLAAQDTTALTLTWFFFALQKYPEVEERLSREVAQVLSAEWVDKDTYLTTDHVHKLVYLEATIREVLRFYTTFPNTRREVVDDTLVCGTPVRKGEFVFISMYGLARNPKVWGPDAATFNPSRWIDEQTGELLTFSASKFAAFSTGPRMCIDMKLAYLEIRVVVANLLRRYKFTTVVPNDGSYVVRVALTPKSPLLMRADRISAPVV